MKKTVFALLALGVLSGCVTQSGEDGAFAFKEITPECRGLAYNDEFVLRPTSRGPVVFALGKCRLNDGGSRFRVVAVESITPSTKYAKVRVSDKFGRRELLVRRNHNLYLRQKFAFPGRWIEKAPQ